MCIIYQQRMVAKCIIQFALMCSQSRKVTNTHLTRIQCGHALWVHIKFYNDPLTAALDISSYHIAEFQMCKWKFDKMYNRCVLSHCKLISVGSLNILFADPALLCCLNQTRSHTQVEPRLSTWAFRTICDSTIGLFELELLCLTRHYASISLRTIGESRPSDLIASSGYVQLRTYICNWWTRNTMQNDEFIRFWFVCNIIRRTDATVCYHITWYWKWMSCHGCVCTCASHVFSPM